jgi:hypothetical protein
MFEGRKRFEFQVAKDPESQSHLREQDEVRLGPTANDDVS